MLISDKEFTKNIGIMMITTYLFYMAYLGGFLEGLF